MFSRLLKWIALAIFACLILSAALVLTFRWIDPPTSAFMLETRVQALLEGDRTYRTDYEWASLEHISPHAAASMPSRLFRCASEIVSCSEICKVHLKKIT